MSITIAHYVLPLPYISQNGRTGGGGSCEVQTQRERRQAEIAETKEKRKKNEALQRDAVERTKVE